MQQLREHRLLVWVAPQPALEVAERLPERVGVTGKSIESLPDGGEFVEYDADVECNTRRIVDGIAQARALGADLVAFPELAITGYPPEDLLFKSAFIEANLAALAEVTKPARGLTAVVGFVDKRQDLFNAAAVIHDGALAGVYHKQYLPNYGVFDENRYFQAGREASVFSFGQTCVAVNVCEDLWYPTGPTTPQALAGAELIVTINGSPYHAGKARFRERMVATRAADDVVWLAFVNMVGGQDELVFDGASVIVDPHGETVARGRQFVEEMVTADLDLDAVFRARLQDSRRRKETLDVAGAPRISLPPLPARSATDRKSTRLNSSHTVISYAVFCLKKKRTREQRHTRIGICRRQAH